MKKFAALFCLGLSFTAAFGQGLINFVNDSSTLISQDFLGQGPTPISGAGTYYFALLTSPIGANTFTFAGVYATNQAVAGLINGGSGVAVPGWTPGTARDFVVVGWSSVSGIIYNPLWLNPDLTLPPGYYKDSMPIGASSIGTGVAGGLSSSGLLPNLDIFGGATGIQNGFALVVFVPEPSSMVFAGLAAAVMLIFRRRSGPNHSICSEPGDAASVLS